MTVTVYHYPKCSTCRKALTWLRARDVDVNAVDIVASPPSAEVLRNSARLAGVPATKLFNTSGVSYREGGFKAKLPTMSEDEMFAALAADGKLIKRPLVVAPAFAIVGFREDDYCARFAD